MRASDAVPPYKTMKALFALLLALSAASPRVGHAEPLEIQPGTWEITTKFSQPSRRLVERLCLPDRNLVPLVHGPDMIEDDPCHPIGPAKTSRRSWAIGLQCEDGSQIQARFKIDAPQHLSGTVVRVGGKRALLQKQDLTGRWLRPGCGGRG
jgi:hypothetical protein